MEDLFSTSLKVNGQDINYRVVFDHEKYIFLSSTPGQTSYGSFLFWIEHDDWRDEGGLPPDIRNQAIDALEKYLMRQH